MRCIASFKTACRIVGAGTSCFVQNIKMLVRSIAQHAHYLREISCYPSTMRPDKAHCASGTTLAPSETGGPREVTIQSRIHSNDEQLL